MPIGSKGLNDKSGQRTSPGSHLSGAVLQAENQRLRAQLDAMMREARLNQEKMRRFDLLERKVIGAASLAELIRTLLQDYRTLFELDAVSLVLVDPQHEVAQILASQAAGVPEDGLIFLDSDQALQVLYAHAGRPILTPNGPAHAFLFETEVPGVVSLALLPLVHHGRFIGSLNLGSKDRQRFLSGSSTDFLERLAALVAVCLDSALATERLKLAGLTDALTGVHNRRYFESRCLEEVVAARRSGAPLVCMFLDVDHFKKLNDTLGHQAGDEVLGYVARLIKAQLRGSDVVARYGGEEFVVLLPATPLQAGQETAERIRRIVAAQSVPAKTQETIRVTVSIGVSMLDTAAAAQEPGALVADMVSRADKALYEAKATGRNRVMSAPEA